MSQFQVDKLIQRIRAEIRAEKPYIVGGLEECDCKLNQNECPFDLPADLKEQILEDFARIPFNRYPTEQPFQLIETLAVHHDHPAEGILVGNGSNDLTQTLALCFIDTGIKVALPRPMFALYESVVRMHGGIVVPVAPLPDLHFDTDALIQAASSEEVTVTVVASPNNPTGLSISFEALEKLCASAPGFVVIDEAYQEFCPQQKATSLLDAYPNLIVMRTLSKAFGLAGLRIGYMLGHPSVISEILKARLPFMIDRLAETAALALLHNSGFMKKRVEAIKRGILSLTSELQSIPGVSVIPSSTNFVLFKTGQKSGELANRLTRKGVVVRNMSGYPELTDYIRVTTGTDAENKEFITALKRALKEAA